MMTREELIAAIKAAAAEAGDPYSDADIADLQALSDDDLRGIAADFGVDAGPVAAPPAATNGPVSTRQQQIDAILAAIPAESGAETRPQLEAMTPKELADYYKAVVPAEKNPRTEAQKKARAQIDDLYWKQGAMDEATWRALDAWVNEAATGDLLAGADRAGALDARIRQQVGVAQRTVSDTAAKERADAQQRHDEKVRRAFDDAYDIHVLTNARNIAEGRVPATDAEQDAAEQFLNFAATGGARNAAFGRFQRHAFNMARALTKEELFGEAATPIFTPQQFEAWLMTVGPLEFAASDVGTVMKGAFPGVTALGDIPGATDFQRVLQQQVVPFYAPERRTMDAVAEFTAVLNDVQERLDAARDRLQATDDRRALMTQVSRAATMARSDAVAKFTELARSGAAIDPTAFAGQVLTQRIAAALTGTGAAGLVKAGDIYGTIGALQDFKTPQEVQADAQADVAAKDKALRDARSSTAGEEVDRTAKKLQAIISNPKYSKDQQARAAAQLAALEAKRGDITQGAAAGSPMDAILGGIKGARTAGRAEGVTGYSNQGDVLDEKPRGELPPGFETRFSSIFDAANRSRQAAGAPILTPGDQGAPTFEQFINEIGDTGETPDQALERYSARYAAPFAGVITAAQQQRSDEGKPLDVQAGEPILVGGQSVMTGAVEVPAGKALSAAQVQAQRDANILAGRTIGTVASTAKTQEQIAAEMQAALDEKRKREQGLRPVP